MSHRHPARSHQATQHDRTEHHGHQTRRGDTGQGPADHTSDSHPDPDGHTEHSNHGDHVGQFRRLFWIMLALAIPVVGFNDMFAHLVGYHLPEAAWVWWVSPVLGTVVYLWGGRPFLTGAISELRTRQPGMMLLIGLAITVAFLSSWG